MASDVPLMPEPDVTLPQQGEGESVVDDYHATGLTLRRHPLAILRPALDRLRLDDTRALASLRHGAKIRLPGVVLIRQRPGTSKGVIFVTVEDEFGTGNLVVFAKVAEEHRRALVGARLLLAEGRVERLDEAVEVAVNHLIVTRLEDRTELLDRLSLVDQGGDWAERSLGRADEVRRPDPGSRRPTATELPPSRDFR
jgi:error-prone DNA polymerase